MTKECLMVAYGDGHVGFEHLSEGHLLMHGQQINDWTIVAMVEFHATRKEHRNLHIEIEQNRKDAAQEFDKINQSPRPYSLVRFQPSGKSTPSSSPVRLPLQLLAPPGRRAHRLLVAPV